MHRIREILRQKWGLGRTHREIARSVGCSVGAVWKVVDRASAAGLDLAGVDVLDDAELETRVQGVRVEPPVSMRELPDFAAVHREHLRPSVTPELLHLEILDDRCGTRATVMTSQISTEKWHDLVGDPTTADAICDRLMHNAHRIALKGPSRRKGKKDSNSD